MALFLTWVVLLAISMIGRKKRAKSGDRQPDQTAGPPEGQVRHK